MMMLRSLCLSIVLMVSACAKEQSSQIQDVKVLGGSFNDIKVSYAGDDSNLKAKFFFRSNEYAAMHDEQVRARKIGNNYELLYKDTVIGLDTPNKLYLCDRYNISGKDYNFACNAVFYNDGWQAPSLPGSTPQTFKGYAFDISLADPDSSYSLQSERFTLESHARNQINQYGTGTCAYNAATGIMEILYSMNTRQSVDFSEPYYLAYSPSFGHQTSWFWNMYGRVNAETGGMVRNSDIPVTSVYRPGQSFSGADQEATNRFRQNSPSKVQLPFSMESEKLFFKASWNGGYMRDEGRASSADFDQMVEWFMTNKKPVNVHHWINGIWHSVIMIGYDPSSQNILIKDSLGNSHLKGTWKSKRWFLSYGYAAVGVTDGRAPDPGNDNNDSDDILDPGNDDNNGGSGNDDTPNVDPVDPGDDDSWSPEDKFKVALKVGNREGRYRAFFLSLQGSSADLARVKSVTYHVHSSFGQYATYTSSDASDSFESIRYLTYANGWRTTKTVLTVSTPAGEKTVTLNGTYIGW